MKVSWWFHPSAWNQFIIFLNCNILWHFLAFNCLWLMHLNKLSTKTRTETQVSAESRGLSKVLVSAETEWKRGAATCIEVSNNSHQSRKIDRLVMSLQIYGIKFCKALKKVSASASHILALFSKMLSFPNTLVFHSLDKEKWRCMKVKPLLIQGWVE